MAAAMDGALAQLRELHAELKSKQGQTFWVFDSANLGGTLDQAIVSAQTSIDFLAGELRQRVFEPEQFQEGVRGAAAWDAWRDLADHTGTQLGLALGTLSRWTAAETLSRIGYDLRAAAQAVATATPWVALAFGALFLVYLFSIGGRR